MRRAITKIMPQKPEEVQADFYLVIDDPHRSWLPGDEVSGQVVLVSKKNLVKPVITLSLIGTVRVNATPHSKFRPKRHTLFNHQITLYGDQPAGLYAGEHRFPFIVKLPNKRIYTSIDFGKGSIGYVLRTSIDIGGRSANTYEKTINLIAPIDVAKLPPPKPRRLAIKEPRAQTNRLSRTHSTNSERTYSSVSSNGSDTQLNTNFSSYTHSNYTHSSHTPNTHPQSSQSQLVLPQNPQTANGVSVIPQANNETSHSSALIQASQSHPSPLLHAQSNNSDSPFASPAHTPAGVSPSNPDSPSALSVRVSLEVTHRGYLRGEQIPVKVRVNHTRKVHDLNGIIVTFVRVCRLENGTTVESFRKDLQQSVVPLYVDPNTLSAEVTTNVRIPADAFPTIVGCPLVSFQYFLEVLVNLSGKSMSLEENTEKRDETNVLVNTDRFKRSKKFIQLTTEVVVGTHRSDVVSTNDQANEIMSALQNAPANSPNVSSPYAPGNSPALHSPHVHSPLSVANSPMSVSSNAEEGADGSAQGTPAVPAPGIPAPGISAPGVPVFASSGTQGALGLSSSIPVIPEIPGPIGHSEASFITQPVSDTPALCGTPGQFFSTPVYTPSDVPDYAGHHASPVFPDTPAYPSGTTDEKERMRAHELGLLPSNPEGEEEEEPVQIVQRDSEGSLPTPNEYEFFARTE